MNTQPLYFVKNIANTLNYYRGHNKFYRNYSLSSAFQKCQRIGSMDEKELIRGLQVMKRDKRAQFAKSVPSYVSLQVLGCGVRGSPASLYVSTDHAKYLFNCGEGTQRLAHEHRLRLTRLEHVLFTTATWKNMGGLPGMALTIQESGVPQIYLHGPAGVSDIFETVKRFALLPRLSVTEANCSENNVHEDSSMKIRYVHLTNKQGEIDEQNDDFVMVDNTNYYAHAINKNGKRTAEQKSGDNKVQRVDGNQRNLRKIKGCVAYICQLTAKPGRLLLEKCVERGITPGPIFGQLKAGNDVTLPDGTVIKSSDVCEPEIPGAVFIVLECPSEDYLESLISNEAFKDYQTDSGIGENEVACIVHFTPENILKMDKYREWMKKFPESTEHLILNSENNSYSFEALHKIQHKLNLLHSTIFPIIPDFPDKEADTDNAKMDENETNDKLQIHRAKTLNAMYLRPPRGLDKETIVKIDRNNDVDEAFAVDGFLDSLAEIHTDINAKTKSLVNAPEYPKVLILGTGSCIPNKVRNTSGILLQIDSGTSILLDCGEGTSGQLVRFFGREKADEVLKSIKAVYISHLHADHHLGLLNIFQERQRITDDPIILFAPRQIYSWLQLYHHKFQPISQCYSLIHNQNLNILNRKILPSALENMRDVLKIQDITTVEVKHCLYSFGVALTLNNGQKIVYSGDTQPCDYLVDLGRDCDLLIHEATMEDGMEAEARKKMHSTISQAIKIGDRMNSKFTLLTHFSQRYSKIPRLPENSDDCNLQNVGIAFDNMHVSLSNLPLLPLLYPCLRILFSEYVIQLEEKAQRRLQKEEKIRMETR